MQAPNAWKSEVGLHMTCFFMYFKHYTEFPRILERTGIFFLQIQGLKNPWIWVSRSSKVLEFIQWKLENINESINIRHICIVQSNFTFPWKIFFARYVRASRVNLKLLQPQFIERWILMSTFSSWKLMSAILENHWILFCDLSGNPDYRICAPNIFSNSSQHKSN